LNGRRASVRLQAPAYLEAVQDRHCQIEDDHIGWLSCHDVEHLPAVGGLLNDEAGEDQRRGVERPLISKVVGDQYPSHISPIHYSRRYEFAFLQQNSVQTRRSVKITESLVSVGKATGQMPAAGKSPSWTLRSATLYAVRAVEGPHFARPHGLSARRTPPTNSHGGCDEEFTVRDAGPGSRPRPGHCGGAGHQWRLG